MNRRNGINQSIRMLAVVPLALCAIALAFPVATACAAGAELAVARQEGDGYGTAWFVDLGEWYVAPDAPIVLTSQAQPDDDGYLSAWFIDPGEWYMAPQIAVAQASEAESGDEEEPGAWFVDPGEWYAAPGGPLAHASEGESASD